MNIKIRKVTIKDWLVVKKLNNEFWAYHRPLFRKIDKDLLVFIRSTSKSQFQKWIRARKNYFIVAMDGTKIIGYAFARLQKDRHNSKILFGHLTQIYVSPNYRGKGVSDKLWEDILNWFKIKKVNFLQLFVTINNHHAINLYKKWGFKSHIIFMRQKF